MKSYENSNVKCMLNELERIIIHAEKAIPSVQEGNNERWEQINFEQLTRESESKINMLRRELDALTDIEAMKMVAEEMNKIMQRFHKFDVQFLAEINKQLKIEQKELEEAEKWYSSYKNNQDNEVNIIQYNEPDLFVLLLDCLNDKFQNKTKKNLENIVEDARSRVRLNLQLIARFEQITAEFRSVVREISGIHTMLLQKINQASVSNIENHTNEEKIEILPSSNKGRKKEQWWGGKWENLTEQEVEQHLKQAYDATSSMLSNLKEEKNIAIDKALNAVWAAVYFYAAESEGLVNPQKSANNIGYIGNAENPRGLYNIGVNCNKGTVHKYYKIIKTFLKATIDNDSNLPYVNQLIQKIKEEKNNDTHEWLRKNLIYVTREIEDKLNPSEDVIMFVVKNLTIIRKIFFSIHPHFS